MSLKSLLVEGSLPSRLHLPKVTLSSFPSSHVYNEKRRARPFINEIYNDHMYLAAAPVANVGEQNLTSIESTKNNPEIDRPYQQILDSIQGMESSLRKQLDQLKQGAHSFVDQSTKAGKDMVVEGEANQQNPIASSVVSASQAKVPKPRPPKRKKNSVLPIPEHEIKRQRKSKS